MGQGRGEVSRLIHENTDKRNNRQITLKKHSKFKMELEISSKFRDTRFIALRAEVLGTTTHCQTD